MKQKSFFNDPQFQLENDKLIAQKEMKHDKTTH